MIDIDVHVGIDDDIDKRLSAHAGVDADADVQADVLLPVALLTPTLQASRTTYPRRRPPTLTCPKIFTASEQSEPYDGQPPAQCRNSPGGQLATAWRTAST
ncbi:hypothetical protein ONZ51_g8206 [Trametes cubensis]|uniref:Uncharacterized protein n=1 Tax=Trametes cubensis TaxID=1111947 RepID=A0AAD7X8T2_9APHY|nr:hypothetical protein ONZ51_g8206 [Trametes cubensis]